MRKLASIQIITNIIPIKDKDNIVLATVLGWNVIVRKDQFQIGDKCVYIEIDSILPENNINFEFLKKHKYRIKTMKMAGTISQGICFSPSILTDEIKYKEGDDVTEILHIEKYEPDENNIEEKSVEVKKNSIIKLLNKYSLFRHLFPTKKEKNCFPEYVTKTDQDRIQLFPHLLLDKTKKYIVTEKIEGSSATFSLKQTNSFFGTKKYNYEICSRNISYGNIFSGKIARPLNSFERISQKAKIEERLKDQIKYYDKAHAITIQGELIAPKIQGNIYKVKEEELYIFDIIIHYKDKPDVRLNYYEQIGFVNLSKSALKLVPLIDTKYILPNTIEELLNYANGESKLYPTLREGLVLRTTNTSFKVVSNEYLVKRGY